MHELFVCLRLSESTQPGRKTIEIASHIKALFAYKCQVANKREIWMTSQNDIDIWP